MKILITFRKLATNIKNFAWPFSPHIVESSKSIVIAFGCLSNYCWSSYLKRNSMINKSCYFGRTRSSRTERSINYNTTLSASNDIHVVWFRNTRQTYVFWIMDLEGWRIVSVSHRVIMAMTTNTCLNTSFVTYIYILQRMEEIRNHFRLKLFLFIVDAT